MTGLPLIIVFVLAIVVMIVAISKFKVHPFLSIMAVSLILALVAGIPLVDVKNADGTTTSGIATVIGAGFSGTFSSIGIVIILGALIGTILEKTGAALKLADMVIKVVGKKNPELAMELMGWVVSIPVFCDSGFVILDPIRKALVKRTGTSSVAMTVALSAGLYISHVFIPPTPGPIAAANTLGIGDNLLMVMGMGVLASILPLIAGLFYAKFIGKKVKSADELTDNGAVTKTYEELVAEYGKLPNGFNALAPILVPIVLMALGSISSMAGWGGFIGQLCSFLGKPIIALAVGTVCGVIQLATTNGSVLSDHQRHPQDRWPHPVRHRCRRRPGQGYLFHQHGQLHHRQRQHSGVCRYPVPVPAGCHPEIRAGLLHRGHHHHGRHSGSSDGRAGSGHPRQGRADRYGHRRRRDDGVPRQRLLLLGCHQLWRDDARPGLQDPDRDDAGSWRCLHDRYLHPVSHLLIIPFYRRQGGSFRPACFQI